MTVRVRFAPSPTGFLHVGGARTALFNWLFARRYNGTFIVRVEDTDEARERPEFRAEIFRALEWLGLDEDEGPIRGGAYGPYVQSERSGMYAAALATLQASGHAYPCFCAPGDADEEQYAKARCRCKELSVSDVAERTNAASISPPLRLFVDAAAAYEVDDLIRGRVVFPPGEVEPFIIAKAGGAPLYNFAAVVDDAAMKITHVIRGEEHLANTPKQQLLYQALGFPVPQFAHLPIILNTDRRKLSKRDGATAVSDYRTSGFLPDALRNFLALLGWSPGGDREIMTLQEMIDAFDLARVQKSGAVFDQVKLTWMNGEYIRRAPLAEIVAVTAEMLAHDPDAADLRTDAAHLAAVCEMLQARAKTISEIVAQRYLFSRSAVLAWDAEAVAKRVGDRSARERLQSAARVLPSAETFDAANIEAAIRGLAEQSGIKAGDYIGPMRVALSGAAVSPGIFELCAVLGHDLTLARIEAFLHAFPIEVA